MSNKVLLVTDMLRDFIEPNGALPCGESARRIVPYIQNLISQFREENSVIIFLNDAHQENDREFEVFTKHCIDGTRGAEIIDELDVQRNDKIIKKTRYNGFYQTNLEKTLLEIAPTEIHVVGVCTSICVMDTVSGLRDRDYKVFVHRHGVADFDHESHTFSLTRIDKVLGANIV